MTVASRRERSLRHRRRRDQRRPRGPRDTAWEAHLASGPVLSTHHRNAPPGAIGWYRTVGEDPEPGHVVVHLGGDTLAMASDAVTTEWGHASGTSFWIHYRDRKPAMQWVGWTYDYVGQVLTDATVVVRLVGQPALYLLTSATTRYHLTPGEWAPLKARGVRPVAVSPEALDYYSVR